MGWGGKGGGGRSQAGCQGEGAERGLGEARMDDLDISFDFENNLNAGGTDVAALPSAGGPVGVAGPGPGAGAAIGPTGDGGRPGSGALVHQAGRPQFTQYVSKKNFRQTVCRHWLRGLCMKGEQCGFLHQFDQSRMPVCRFFAKYGVCREPECVFKHSTEEVKECNMYNLGFCIHGPLCRYKHTQRAGPPPPPETVEEAKPRQFRNAGGGAAKARQASQAYRNQFPQLQGPPRQQRPMMLPSSGAGGGVYGSGGSNNNYNNTGRGGDANPPGPRCPPVPPQQDAQRPPPRQMQPQPPAGSASRPPPRPSQPAPSQPDPTPAPPPREDRAAFLRDGKCRFFVVHVRNRRDLNQAFSTCQWPTNVSSRMKLNEAFSTVKNVLLVFVDISNQALAGVARMEGAISKQRAMIARRPGAASGSTIPLKWISKDSLPSSESGKLVNKWNNNKPLCQSRDGQEVDTESGEAAVRSLL